jgi:hypothetical protein
MVCLVLMSNLAYREEGFQLAGSGRTFIITVQEKISVVLGWISLDLV